MSLVTRIFVVCVGGCGLIPFFVGRKKTNNLRSSLFLHEVPKDSSFLQEGAGEKNCKVIKKLSENVFRYLGRKENDYITISCEGTNIDNNENMPNNWKGLFPKALFKSQAFHEKGFEIRTKTEELGSRGYSTVFSGGQLENSLVVGEWSRKTSTSEGKRFITVSVLNRSEGTNPIYLLFPNKNPT